MKLLPLSVICFITVAPALAQQDSTKFDLGSTAIEQKSTQYLTVMAENLQRFPFSTLEEAINLYFNGVFTTRNTSAYIIDGNISTTIDALSIYDVESVTLIINAQTRINGIAPNQQLIIIKTKSGFTRKSGITAAASGYITRKIEPGAGKQYEQDKQTFYQQYNIRGTYYKGNSEFGASVNFLREAFLNVTGYIGVISSSPAALNRFRVNTWFNTTIGKSTLTLRLNASPQDSGVNYMLRPQLITSVVDINSKGFALNPTARLFTRFNQNWSNDLNISYINSNTRLNEETVNYTYYDPNPAISTSTDNEQNKVKQWQLLLRNKIAYEKKSGDWTITPALNFLARLNKSTTDYSNIFRIGEQTATINTEMFQLKDKEIAATPSISFSFKELFYFNGGAQYNSFKKEFLSSTTSTIFPFASASFDVLKALEPTTNSSVKIFASYTKGNSWKERMYRNNIGYYYNPGIQFTFNPNLSEDPATSIGFGTDFSSKENKFQISYAYEKTKYSEFTIIDIPFGGRTTRDAESTLSTHRIKLILNLKNYSSLINIFNNRYNSTVNKGYTIPPIGGFPGNIPGNYTEIFTKGWSGGWVNNFTFNKFIAGFNAMYYFNDDINSLLLQHIYAGYKTTIKHHKSELYISSRNLAQNKKSQMLTGYKVYYGLGVMVSM
jgi:hypothetical protein